MNDKPKYFDDDEGFQAYDPEDIPPDRELLTTPYDAPVRTLVQEIQEKTLIVNPKFQRRSVWTQRQRSRFIESLLLNIPVPVCYFAEDVDGIRVVVDGQQRLRAIDEFLAGQYKLKDLQVLSLLNGCRWTDLSPRQARMIRNRTIRCIVISAKSDPNIRFEVFERLNTAVTPLNDQELRNCIYRGPFNELLERLSLNETWLRLLRKKQPNTRLNHHELILRFFALSEKISDYRPPLKKLLNDHMKAHREVEGGALEAIGDKFVRAVDTVDAAFGEKAFRRVKILENGSGVWDAAINRAVFDIQMLGLNGLDIVLVRAASPDLTGRFETLCRSDKDFADSITKATADKTKFYLRLSKFREIMSECGLESPALLDLPQIT